MIKSILFFLIGFFCSITTTFSQQSLRTQLLGQFDPPTSDLPELGGTQYNDVWGFVSPAGKEIAILGHNQYTVFVDVSNPSNPVELYRYAAGDPENWRDYKTYDQYAYGVCDSCNEGLGIYDLTGVDCGDPIQHVRQITTQFGASHNIYIDEPNARLYAVGMPGSNVDMYVYDLAANPANPPLIGSIDFNNVVNNNNDYYIHDVYVRDNIAYASHGNTGFYIWDVSNLSSVSLIAEDVYNGYNHSSWVTEDGDYAIVAEEVPTGLPLVTVDLRNMFNGNIQDIDQFSDHLEPSGASTAHNPYVRNDYAFISYYHDGLKVYDYSNPSNPVLYAYYDTYASNGNSYPSGYAGAWGCYPYFPSGNILVSDMVFGLHIISVDGTETCSDGIQNQDETGVDCGGKYCLPCISCADGVQNRDETGIDCGGSFCCACPCSDADGDSVCDDVDQCPGFDDTVDIDEDNIPDACDNDVDCSGFACNDSNSCTVNDVYDSNCNCAGISLDEVDNGSCNLSSPYCDVSGSTTTEISSVQIGNINNTSGANSYSDYSDEFALMADQGDNVDVSIEVSVDGGGFGSIGTWVYIDFNQNGVFDTDERVVDASGGSVNTTFNIPSSAANGATLMRVMSFLDFIFITPSGPCSSSEYAEIEDYAVIIGFDQSNCTPGSACDDNDVCTSNDVYDANCNCSGTFQDSDNDGVCNADDICPGGDDTIDSDGDGIPDACDGCSIFGNPCNDGDVCTTNDAYDSNCICSGTYQDSDSDGVCNAEDICPGGDDTVDSDGDGIPDACDDCSDVGNPCNDGDACTINDVYDANCNCSGTFQDSDNDGVCNADDICPGGDDTLDSDGDGIPDACDGCSDVGNSCNDGDACTINDVYDATCNCAGTYQDSDNDGVCDANDICSGGDDTIDSDGDGIPDFCDPNVENGCETDIIEMGNIAGDLKLDGSCYGIIMISEDGSCYKITVLNSGQLKAVNVDCN